MLEFRSRELTLVRRLRIAGAGLEPVTSRLRAERAFAALDLPALGLPPSAVLCIRALADPRPRSCRFAADGLRLTHAWRDSLRSEIERKARGASRPAREAVTASAECVLFADTSELLSAAAEDWLAGRAHARWWWKSLLGAAAAAGGLALPGLWLREPEYVPGALEHLAAKGKAAEFARRLPGVEARAILRGLTAAFGWREPGAAVARDEDATAASGSEFVDDNPAAPPGAGFGRKPPWHGLVPECAGAGLDAAGEMLLGVGLSLSRAPAVARREDFARRAAAWARHATEAGPRRDSNPNRTRAARAQPSAPPASTASEGEGGARESDVLRASTSSAPEARDEPAERLSPRASDGDAANKYVDSAEDGAGHRRRPASGDVGEGDDGVRASHASGRDAETGEDDGRGAAPDSAIDARANADGSRDTELDATRGAADESRIESSPPLAARAAPLLEAEIETRFGGLFHLVNLGLFLNLYGDFTTPAEPGLPLPLWDFVALLGRRLAGARVERDAVWPLLARLAGRAPADEPGAHFSPPAEWRAPAEWLQPFGAACVLRWSDAAGRLRVAHPAGFILIDAARDFTPGVSPDVLPDEPTTLMLMPPMPPMPMPTPADADGQLARELRPYVEAGARFELRRVARVRGPRGRTSRARWLDCLSAYAVARLSLALGARGAARLSKMLCERHARVFVTAAHVDVVMRLGELPVEIRYAGLDRDPGWVPAAGRHVAFHFE